MPEGIKRKYFELGKIEYPILSAINIGFAGTSATSWDGRRNVTDYTWSGKMLGRVKVENFPVVFDRKEIGEVKEYLKGD